jgi:hypothetical protein
VDTTQAVLSQKGFKLFLFIRELTSTRPDWAKEFGVIWAYAKAKNIPVYFITGDFETVQQWLRYLGVDHEGRLLKCDATAVKTAARTNPTLYLIKRSTILQKWSYSDFDQAILELNALPEQTLAASTP